MPSTRPKPGPVKGLRFNPRNHVYRLDGRPVTGVTSILRVLDKPALPQWAAKTVAEYVADHADGVEQLRAMGRGPMVSALKDVPWQKRDDAADRGTILHAFAEDILRGEQVDVTRATVAAHFAKSGKFKSEHAAQLAADRVDLDDIVAVLEGAARFMDDWDIQPLLTEAPVAHRADWWAGTVDTIATYRHPVTGQTGTGVFDWKSGKAIYTEHVWQLNAYGHAEFTGLNGDEHPLPATDAAFGIHIQPDGYAAHPVKYGPDVYEEFRVIRRLHTIHKAATGDWRKPGTGHVGEAIHPHDDE